MDDARVWELHCQGLNVRAIAKRMGKDRNRVHRSITRQAEAAAAMDDDSDDPWADAAVRLALMDAENADYEPVAPFSFVGFGDDDGVRTRFAERRFLDGNGRSANELDFWRYHTYMANEDGDYDGPQRIRDDMTTQIEAAGYRFLEGEGWARV